MIHERPGASNDRETYIGNLDQEVDLDTYRKNFDKISWSDKFFICKECGELFSNEKERDECKHLSEEEMTKKVLNERGVLDK